MGLLPCGHPFHRQWRMGGEAWCVQCKRWWASTDAAPPPPVHVAVDRDDLRVLLDLLDGGELRHTSQQDALDRLAQVAGE